MYENPGEGARPPCPPLPMPMIGVCKIHFFQRPKYDTLIDDVLRSLWFFTDTVRRVIHTPVEHVEVKAAHFNLKMIQGDLFLFE